MRIGEFARRAGVSTSKIRFYESRGLLPQPARQANGYRSYDAADLRIIAFIKEASLLGFSLAEVSRFMERPPEQRRDKRRLVRALETKLAIIDCHLVKVHEQRQRVAAFIAQIGADQ